MKEGRNRKEERNGKEEKKRKLRNWPVAQLVGLICFDAKSPSQQLWSCRDSQLNPTFFLGKLD